MKNTAAHDTQAFVIANRFIGAFVPSTLKAFLNDVREQNTTDFTVQETEKGCLVYVGATKHHLPWLSNKEIANDFTSFVKTTVVRRGLRSV
ncbi:MAG: hypothetical protein EOP06_02845 [Proteobacteria bacterium]|nr:MAG: hypothetical protein EOP06_02845 [Pseudomonadota bacterium]